MKLAVLILTLVQSTSAGRFGSEQTWANLKEECPGDVAFLVETSEQLADFKPIADRVLSVASSLKPAVLNNRKNTHIGLTLFSNPDSQGTSTYDFNWGSNIDNVKNTLKSLVDDWHDYVGLSILGYGLYHVTKLLTDAGSGRRSNVPSVLVIFAQGYQDPDYHTPGYPPSMNDPALWPNPEAQAAYLRDLGVKIYAVAIPPSAGHRPTTPSTKMVGNQLVLMRNVLVNLTGGHSDHVVGFDQYDMIPPKINALLAGTKDCYTEPCEVLGFVYMSAVFSIFDVFVLFSLYEHEYFTEHAGYCIHDQMHIF